ncbi:class I SAM-dependent methyltransferase [Acetatifactor muris]|uniref:class I SAM-dependent methyltransferase n=1 Tax=Acetatifactor muris TaxID=879566 RepID=UPI0023F453B4|nr:methyltransferase domain-containing protein [Acetatifactor muris]
MRHGDFTELAKFYVDRPGYSLEVLRVIRNHVMREMGKETILVADVGAGTGKLTENLAQIGLTGYAVEPNDAMRGEGIKLFEGNDAFRWISGSAEITNLSDNCADWILMGSSFHWTDAPKAIAEFHRVLQKGGFFTAIWNPRNIESSKLHMEIEDIVYSEVPGMKRVSSGATVTTEDMYEKMCGTGLFDGIIFMEAPYCEHMTVERYMNIWRSVNDIRVQAGEEGFRRILKNIEDKLKGMDEIDVPYKARSWTVRAI